MSRGGRLLRHHWPVGVKRCASGDTSSQMEEPRNQTQEGGSCTGQPPQDQSALLPI